MLFAAIAHIGVWPSLSVSVLSPLSVSGRNADILGIDAIDRSCPRGTEQV
jgi:hypothetical protein